MTDTAFTTLFSPLDLGPFSVSNRLIMGSMHTGLEESPKHFGRLAAFFRQRATGGAGLIITGGVAPTDAGRAMPGGAAMLTEADAEQHRIIPEAVHEVGGRICLQLLHTGRYGFHPNIVSATDAQAPISPFPPRALNDDEIQAEIEGFARAAQLAEQAGYDGIEIMGSEGYFINQFTSPALNRRTDDWGGSAENRQRLAIEIVRAIKAAVSDRFLLIFRLSLLDLVPNGTPWSEVEQLAHRLVEEGVHVLNSGIGWHESRVPTIASMVPAAAFREATAKLRQTVSVPVAVTNRINRPEQAEDLLSAGTADLVTMARPWLADADWGRKAGTGKADEINVCIGCNQACLDHIFQGKPVTCLVNPYALQEDRYSRQPAVQSRRVAVIGGGVGGLSAAVELAERGHEVHLYERGAQLGGQFLLAARVPGKEDYRYTLRYYEQRLQHLGVSVHLNAEVTPEQLQAAGQHTVVLATGVRPRVPDLPGIDHGMVVRYDQLLRGDRAPGTRIAVMGAGGIGFDVGEFLLHCDAPVTATEAFLSHWGIDASGANPGGLIHPQPQHAARKITLCQRSDEKPGKRLGKTTGWIHRLQLRTGGVQHLTGIQYERIDDQGLWYTDARGDSRCLAVDQIVLCTGQESELTLQDGLLRAGLEVHTIGGADKAAELDAKRAIRQGLEVAVALSA
ncbi:NADPH-dependent 2,4-dienoyl-CoA reductase [Natronospirillum operosum]|uniref:NADPH-dependent 2,4-dienoyl-CoA reductase n=1 Tax=Natronospirillum operosum TaxID=2759953 RepID=A0A4Z0WAJ5_9GAMM|nr:NADPH-dependent 2,4-dienoyl-CoA reductase [Natronospirillum operosum]TGG95162.1 NADPH-dependent 2,4-dienoyl-CoA reductase [Natronospirillum operosum]